MDKKIAKNKHKGGRKAHLLVKKVDQTQKKASSQSVARLPTLTRKFRTEREHIERWTAWEDLSLSSKSFVVRQYGKFWEPPKHVIYTKYNVAFSSFCV